MRNAPDSVPRHLRRCLLHALAGIGALAAAGLLAPLRAFAAEWSRNAFTATTIADALKANGSAVSTESTEIVFTAPDIAENGAQVIVEVTSRLPDTQKISIFVDRNPMPLAASFVFGEGALPQVRVPLKMAETSRVRAVANTADGKVWHAQREIRVTLGGCAA